MAYMTEKHCDIWDRLTWRVCTGGREGLRYAITKFSRMDSLPNFVTHGAPLRALRARESSAMKVLKINNFIGSLAEDFHCLETSALSNQKMS